MNRYFALMTACLLLLAGCGTSPPVHYYTLENVTSQNQPSATGSPVLAMGPFRLPEYLNRSQIVRRGAGSEIIVDDQNRWAEPLADALHRVLSTNVDQLLDLVTVVAYPSSSLLAIDYRLAGKIDRFDADENGQVVLSVQWSAGDAQDYLLVEPTRSRYVAAAGNPADPSSVVRAMSDVLSQFSRDIAAGVRAGLEQD